MALSSLLTCSWWLWSAAGVLYRIWTEIITRKNNFRESPFVKEIANWPSASCLELYDLCPSPHVVPVDKQEEKNADGWETDLQTLSWPGCCYPLVIPEVSLLVATSAWRGKNHIRSFPFAIVHSDSRMQVNEAQLKGVVFPLYERWVKPQKVIMERGYNLKEEIMTKITSSNPVLLFLWA